MLWELCLFLLTPPVVPLVLIPGAIIPLCCVVLAVVAVVIDPQLLTLI